jgi:hypothetical protein
MEIAKNSRPLGKLTEKEGRRLKASAVETVEVVCVKPPKNPSLRELDRRGSPIQRFSSASQKKR